MELGLGKPCDSLRQVTSGSAVNIVLNADGKEFDESVFEAKLHTLRIKLADG